MIPLKISMAPKETVRILNITSRMEEHENGKDQSECKYVVLPNWKEEKIENTERSNEWICIILMHINFYIYIYFQFCYVIVREKMST